MKIKTLKSICTKRYGKFSKTNRLLYVNMKISEYELKISELKLIKLHLES